MDRRNTELSAGEGRLPGFAPLANPYVPFQMENPPKYEAKKGLIRGTLFPGLDLPFQGNVNQTELPQMPTAELQALAFAVQELALYLDTHREDHDALELYQEYQSMYQKCIDNYMKKYGPLTHLQAAEGKYYGWLNDPWPWEYCRNKED